MLWSDAVKFAAIQHHCDGRLRVGKIRSVEQLEGAAIVRESEAEVASGHLVPFRQRYSCLRHEQVLQGCVHGTGLMHRGRREGADNGALG